jgi:hypothetical protein
MAWATKYQFTFDSKNGVEHRILIQKDGYSGEIMNRSLGRGPVLKKQKNGPICGTSLEIYAECLHDDTDEQGYLELYTSDPKEFRVQLYRGYTLVWTGFVSTELYSAPSIYPPYDVQIVATDGLGELKQVNFVPCGPQSLSLHFRDALSYTGEAHPIYIASSLIMTGYARTDTFNMSIDLDYMIGETYYEVLTKLLDSLHATITMYNGAWLIARETDLSALLSSSGLSVVEISANGTVLTTTLAGVSKTAGQMGVADMWPVGYLSIAIDPRKKDVTVEAPWHTTPYLEDPDMEATTGSPWQQEGEVVHETGLTPFYILGPVTNDNKDWGTIKQSIAVNRIDAAFDIEVKAWPISGRSTQGYRAGKAKIYLVFQPTGSSAKFIGTSGGWGAESRVEVETLDLDGNSEKTFTISVPLDLFQYSTSAGTLTVVIEGLYLGVEHCMLSISPGFAGYRDVINIDNGARGSADTVEITGARIVQANLVKNQFYNGVWLYNNTPVQTFADSLNQGGDFLSITALSYAASVALDRLRTEGILDVPAGLSGIPLFITTDVPAWLETWEWNIYDDELKISALSLPAASIAVDSESITELPDGYTSGSSSSSGGSGGGSGSSPYVPKSASFFEEDGNGGVKLKDEYSGLSVNGFIAAGGVGSSSGGSGIDLDRVWQSLTNNTDKPNVKINAAHIPIATAAVIGGVKVDGTTITIDANGVISAVGGSSGSVTSVALTVPTGLSVSGSPITSSGTLVITFENGYSIPTTAKQSNWDSAYSDAHTHSNKSTLDGISSTKVSNWDAAYGWGDHSGLYLPIGGGTLTGDLRIKGSTNYGRKLNFGDGDYVYLYEDSDDHLKIYASKGLQITTGSSYYVQVDNEVVIGETSRQSAYKLYVNGAGYYNGALTVNSNISSTALITVGSGTSTEIARKICFGSTSYYLSLNTSNQFHFSHGVYSDSFMIAGGAASSSDRRLKGDIEDVGEDRALAVLMQLRPKEWTWNEKSACFAGMRGAGLVAQDVQEVLPFAVMDVGDYLSLNYSVLHAYEIGGLQNHEDRIAALEAENKELKKQLAAYATR